MLVKKEPIPGTSRMRCTFDSGTVLESQLVFLTEQQWKSLRILAALHGARVSAVIGRMIDNAAIAAKTI
jgi:hypothetical protein